VSGLVKSTVDYIMVWQEDEAKIRNVKDPLKPNLLASMLSGGGQQLVSGWQ